jgi:hypothetical protein
LNHILKDEKIFNISNLNPSIEKITNQEQTIQEISKKYLVGNNGNSISAYSKAKNLILVFKNYKNFYKNQMRKILT